MRTSSRAVRVVGMKLLLLSASLTAIAAAGPPAAQDLAQAGFAGMKLVHLILGTMGAGASLLFLPQFSGLVLGRTVFCGILAAVVGTPIATRLLEALYGRVVGDNVSLSGLDNIVAVALGVGGVYIIPAIQRLWQEGGSNPKGFFDRLRGKPPEPPAGGQP